MASPAILATILFLRILCLIALAASVVVMVLNKSTDDIDGTKNHFYDLIAYRCETSFIICHAHILLGFLRLYVATSTLSRITLNWLTNRSSGLGKCCMIFL